MLISISKISVNTFSAKKKNKKLYNNIEKYSDHFLDKNELIFVLSLVCVFAIKLKLNLIVFINILYEFCFLKKVFRSFNWLLPAEKS